MGIPRPAPRRLSWWDRRRVALAEARRGRQERALQRRRARQLRRRLKEGRKTLEVLTLAGEPTGEKWMQELRLRWEDWNEVQEVRDRADLLDSLGLLYPRASDEQLEELLERLGRRSAP